MQLKKIFIILFNSTFSMSAWAWLCPGNFNEINIGETLTVVQAACGAPTSQTTSEATVNLPQEWVYYIAVNSAFYQNISQNSQATLKTTIAFNQGVVTNMSVNGIGVSSTAICGNTIQVGSTQQQVQTTCGKPAFINRGSGSQTGSQSDAAPTKMTELTYVVNNVSTVLVFNNGILAARK